MSRGNGAVERRGVSRRRDGGSGARSGRSQRGSGSAWQRREQVKHDARARYELIVDLSRIGNLRRLRDLTDAFTRYHLEDVGLPDARDIASTGYRAVVCSEMDSHGAERWTTGFMFRVGRERRARWHTVVSIDYVLVDPSSKETFTRMASCLRLLSQFVLKRSKASVVDLVVNVESQLNPVVRNRIVDVLKNEGMHTRHGDSGLFVKRIRSVDKNGVDSAMTALPNVDPRNVRGMRPLVQSTIQPQYSPIGDRIQFIGRIKRGGAQHRAILGFCKRHPDWISPPLTERLTYMQSLFTGKPGDVARYVDSIIEDAHFIIGLDSKGRLSSFMAFILGYSIPALGNTSPNTYVSPENTVFIPTVMCKSSTRETGRWTKVGFQQALSLYKMLFTIISSPSLTTPVELVGVMTTSNGLHPHLLDAIGMKKTASYENTPAQRYTTDYYARML